MRLDRLLRIGTGDDQVHEGQRPIAGNAPAKLGFQNDMIDRWKVTEDIAAQDMGVPITIALVHLDGRMRALALAIGECVVDEARLEDGFDDRA